MDEQPEGARDLHRIGQHRDEPGIALRHEVVDHADSRSGDDGVHLRDDARALDMGAQAFGDLVEVVELR